MEHNYTAWKTVNQLWVHGTHVYSRAEGIEMVMRFAAHPRLWGGAQEYLLYDQGILFARVFDGRGYALERGRWIEDSLFVIAHFVDTYTQDDGE